ncbi:beta-ketoacyl-[acyl-carrier-protein] synthase family protein [Ideonella sp.]|uniref:beta-ketoacyl-[acyl-carrier-protein] synthase family protein n=1 Tax=Ideonella sp. TaxID=1929293 RepID=UPI002B47ABDF|nr:beta-ketoacyl-[acyl-carrier-protein] synthase family protein [Ideonella sp.]HJV72167.1 beta-ketoacyl-[acyl-carrier-protein] synthase family protein [Ideonella sp.]
MTRWPVSAYTLTTALGRGIDAHNRALRAGATGLRLQRFETAGFEAWLGLVEGVDEVELPATLSDFDCRNHRLAWQGMQADGFAARVQQAVQRWGAHRVGVFMGTSTSGILQTEQAYRRRDPVSGALPPDLHYAETHNNSALARFVQAALGVQGPAWSVSTACSSGAKVFGSAARLLALGLIDAAVVGGVDSLCLTTLYGFDSLELLSPDICRPWDAQRHGLSLGEAAAYALLEREASAPVAWLRGVGESSDGHHMSSPLPDGAGAALAMQQALAQAGLAAADIDYINLHGTATLNNDAAEDQAMARVFPGVPCSSTKGATGHTLGAAGAVEAGIAMLALQTGLMPGGQTLQQRDPALVANYLPQAREARLGHVASNSFGFGGTNVCLVFGAAE